MRTARMRGWLLLLALELGAFALVAPPEEATSQPSETAKQQIQITQFDIAPVQNALQPSEYYKPCRDGDKNRLSDLCAQWKAADAAKEAADATLYLGILGGLIAAFTLGVAYWAGTWAREAARHTEAGAKAANTSVTETIRIGEAQVRCYLSGLRARIGFIDNEYVSADIFVKNTGQSPAKDVTCSAFIIMGMTGDPQCYLDEVRDGYNADRRLDIGVGAEERLHLQLKGRLSDWPADKDGNYFIDMQVEVVGKDVFDRPVSETERFTAMVPRKPALDTEWLPLTRSARLA